MVRQSNTMVSSNSINVNNVSGTRVYGVSLSENRYDNVTIYQNKIYFKGTAGSVCAVADFSVGSTINNLRIAGNYFQAGIGFNGALGTNIHIDSNKFEGNTIYNPTLSFTTTSVG